MVQILKNGSLLDFGEEQIPYDISIVRDDTLSTCKIIVESDSNEPLEPATLLFLNDEYWYVDSDKCTYRANKKSTHIINLVDITQILNDRFVEDCKFSQNRYTYENGIERLLKLSNSKDISIDYNYGLQKNIDLDVRYFSKSEEDNEKSIEIYKNENISEDDTYFISGDFFSKDVYYDGSANLHTGNYNIRIKNNSSVSIYSFNQNETTTPIIELKFTKGVLTANFKNVKTLHYPIFTITPVSITINKMYIVNNNMNHTMPTFQFQDTNLYNALESICLSFGTKPRIKYENGFKLTFEKIGATDVIHKFSEIEDIEVIKEYSRNANANKVISNCKNISGDEYVWYPSRLYGKPLRPENNGQYLQQSDKGIFVLDANVKDIKKVRIFPYIEMFASGVKIFSGYFDELFFYNFKDALTKNGLTDTKATMYTSTIIQNFYSEDGQGIYIDVLDGGDVAKFNTQAATNDIFKIEGERKFCALREKKKYDLLTHKYVFDSFVLDEKEKSLYWEQNENYIKGFDGEVIFTEYTIFRETTKNIEVKAYFDLDKVRMSAYYLPQTDIRLETINDCNFEVSKQFNQSGKMIDYSYTKKDLRNYIDTMQSKDVIVTKLYTDKKDIYKAGDKLYDDENDILYIITNVSIKVLGANHYDVIYQLNENFVRRSEFISADSDIRDYNIPITNLVDRQKSFKDVLVFSYIRDKYESRLPVYAAMNVFVPCGRYYVDGKTDKVTNLQSAYDIAIIKCTYDDDTSYSFTLPTTIISSSKVNSKSITVKIPDNYIIGWNYYISYNLQNQLKPFFDGFGINGIIHASGKIYTPIRYTDLNGEIKDIDILLVKSCKISKYDYDNDRASNPNLPSLYLTMPVGETEVSSGEYKNYYSLAKSSVEDVIHLNVKDLLKDKYETLSFTEDIEYKSDKNIELGTSLCQENNNELFYNRISNTRKLRLYDKSKYKYISNDTVLYDDYYEEIILTENVYFDATGKINIDLGQEYDFSKYNVAILNNKGDLIMALNNYSKEQNQYVTLYLNGYKY